MRPEIIAGVIGRLVEGRPAVLEGVRRMRVKGAVYPSLIPGDGEVDGILFKGLTEADLIKLDHFEGDEYERRIATVLTGEAPVDAQVYFASEKGKALLEDKEWFPGDLPDALPLDKLF